MIKLKTHDRALNEMTEIDKFLLIPKKMWNEIEAGDVELSLNGQNVKTRVYDIPCNCVQPHHKHRIVDLREVWNKLNLSDGQEITVEK